MWTGEVTVIGVQLGEETDLSQLFGANTGSQILRNQKDTRDKILLRDVYRSNR